jgi:predicted MFS family arabinose efflux permease
MPAPTPQDVAAARQARVVGLVIAGTTILWLGAQWLGGQFGWEARFAFLFDMAAIAAFVWALIVTMQLWRNRRGS